MQWYLWVLLVVAAYLVASLCTTIWYIKTPSAKPSKLLEFFCYPIGLLIVAYLYVTGNMK